MWTDTSEMFLVFSILSLTRFALCNIKPKLWHFFANWVYLKFNSDLGSKMQFQVYRIDIYMSHRVNVILLCRLHTNVSMLAMLLLDTFVHSNINANNAIYAPTKTTAMCIETAGGSNVNSWVSNIIELYRTHHRCTRRSLGSFGTESRSSI